MELNILEMVLGQIPEAIYFSLFMIFTKNIKEKRLLYTFLMIAGYIILKMFIHYNIWFQILYTCFAYTTIKILYRNKTQIIDVFILTLSIIILGIFSVPFVFLDNVINNIYISCVISKICLFIFLFLIKNKLYNFYKLYCKHWNRNDKEKRKIKSLTLRNISVVLFNVTFYLMNLVILYVSLKK